MEFNNLQEFDQYIPKCLICNKKLPIYLGRIGRYSLKPLIILGQLENTYYNFYLTAYPKNSNLLISIKNTSNNAKFNDKFVGEDLSLFKNCKTCSFTITCKRLIVDGSRLIISTLLDKIAINFTYDKNQIFLTGTENNFTCYFNFKLLKRGIELDFSKFKSHKELARKINLIRTFG